MKTKLRPIVFILIGISFFAYAGESRLKEFWWKSEYMKLVKNVRSLPNGAAQTKYATDPANKKIMNIALRSIEGRGLCLYLMPRRGVVANKDPKTSKIEAPEIIVIWDQNLDSVPEGFWSGKKSERMGDLHPFSSDDLAGTGPATPLLLLWDTAIGFSINHFLHKVDSSLPR